LDMGMRQILILTTAFVAAAFGQDSIPAGTNIEIRTNDAIRANANSADGRVYSGVVANDVADRDGRIVIPRGSNAELIARRVGKDELAIDLDSVSIGEHRYSVSASEQDTHRRSGVGANKRTGIFVGGGAVLGTLLGAVAGGGKGAAIGALAGGAAGAGTQLATRGRSLNVPAESVMTFRLEQPLEINVRDTGHDRNGKHYHENWDRSRNQ
jgi:hypothetical protein